jgi:Flp pilus assembly protein TadB
MWSIISFGLSSVMLIIASVDTKRDTAALKFLRRLGLLKSTLTGIDRWLDYLLSPSFKMTFRQDLERLGIEQEPIPYVKKQVLNGLLVWTIFSFSSIFLDMAWLALIGLLAGIVVAYQPISSIRTKSETVSFELEREAVYLMTNLSQLVLSGVSVYQGALMAGESVPEESPLKPYVRDLVAELHLGKDPGDAFMRLGERLQNSHVQRFGLVLKQLSLASGQFFMETLVKQFDIAEKAKQDLFQKQVKVLPDRLKWPALVLFATIVFLPIIYVAKLIMEMFGTF